MKTYLLLSFLLLPTAFAAFKYPKGVYMPNQVEEAMASAIELNQPLLILLTNNKSNWGACDSASLAAISAAKKKCVVIALDVTDKDNSTSAVSPLVSSGFLPDKVGTTYPFAVIASPDQTVRYAEFSYKQLAAESPIKEGIKAATLKMETTKSELPTPETKLTLYGKGGRYINIFITDIISDTEFSFSRKPNSSNGKKESTANYAVGMKRYIKRLHELQEEEKKIKHAEKIKELMPKFEVEPWTNSEGKTIKATFVSLIDESITLHLPKRKDPVTFPLTKLDVASQQRAKALATKVAEAEAKIKELK